MQRHTVKSLQKMKAFASIWHLTFDDTASPMLYILSYLRIEWKKESVENRKWKQLSVASFVRIPGLLLHSRRGIFSKQSWWQFQFMLDLHLVVEKLHGMVCLHSRLITAGCVCNKADNMWPHMFVIWMKEGGVLQACFVFISGKYRCVCTVMRFALAEQWETF